MVLSIMQDIPAPEVIDRLRGLQGQTCIYKERRFIQCARVTAVEADATGLSVSLERLPAPGFRDEEEPIFSMYGKWEIVSISPNLSLSLAWVGSLLITRPESVELIQQAAKALDPDAKESLGELIRVINRLR